MCRNIDFSIWTSLPCFLIKYVKYALWIVRINAAVREEGMSYSQFIGKLAAKGIDLNRKVLADLAMNEPASFKKLVAEIK